MGSAGVHNNKLEQNGQGPSRGKEGPDSHTADLLEILDTYMVQCNSIHIYMIACIHTCINSHASMLRSAEEQHVIHACVHICQGAGTR